MPVYLTVDDAPSRELPEKLDSLDAHDAPALFFCEGRRLADHPDRARAAVEAGHHLGNHAYSHTHASDLSVDAFRDEVARTEARIDEVYERAGVDRPARVFRFPYGDRGGENADALQRVLADFDFRPPAHALAAADAADRAPGRDWGWTVSVDDWRVESATALGVAVDDALANRTAGAPEVALFHDAGNTPALFDAFLDRLHAHGVKFGDPLALLGNRRAQA